MTDAFHSGRLDGQRAGGDAGMMLLMTTMGSLLMMSAVDVSVGRWRALRSDSNTTWRRLIRPCELAALGRAIVRRVDDVLIFSPIGFFD